MRRSKVLGGVLVVLLPVMTSACGIEADEGQRLIVEDGRVAVQPAAKAPKLEAPAAATNGAMRPVIEVAPPCNSWGAYSGAWVPRSSGSSKVDCSMVSGAHGHAVLQLQLTMNLCYGEDLALDSDFGQATRDALMRTQQKAGVIANGEYGPDTRKAMRHEPANGTACVRVP